MAADLERHAQLLADDTLEGREAGTRGGYAAGNYLVHHFQRHLQPAAGKGQYFQLFGNGYRNILGVLPGTDPDRKDEYVLIGAHYDHVGYGTRRNSNGPIGFIHNGADDNASGVAGILELIDAFAEADLRPRRSVLFALWDGEEKGLLGSQHWVNQPTIPLQQIKLAVNLDMIGRLRNHSLEVIGSRSMPGLRRTVAEANFPDNLILKFPWKLEENSDHYTFFQRRIPVLMFHTGLHADYHRPSDDIDGLNLVGMQSTTRLVFNTLIRLCDDDVLSTFRDAARYEGETRQREFEQALPAPVPRLGISWDPVDPQGPPGLIIRSVRPASAAEHAGLHPDDRLVAVNGHPLLSSSTLQQLAVVASHLDLTVIRPNNATPQTVDVRLDGVPWQLGISWRHSTAEPHSVMLVRVIPHSLADQAGLRVGDRIHQLDGDTFSDSHEFANLAQRINLPASLQIERDGQIRELLLLSPPAELTQNADREQTIAPPERPTSEL